MSSRLSSLLLDSSWYLLWESVLLDPNLVLIVIFILLVMFGSSASDYAEKPGILLDMTAEDRLADKKKLMKAVDIKPGVFMYAGHLLRKDKEFCIAAAQKDVNLLSHAHEDFKSDKDCIMDAVALDYTAFRFAATPLKDEELVRFTLQQSPLALQFFTYAFTNNPDIVRTAVEGNGLALKFASGPLKEDVDICSAAVIQNIEALQFVSEALKNNIEFARNAIISGGYEGDWFPEEIAYQARHANKKSAMKWINV
mgnify:CR=1 FL=1